MDAHHVQVIEAFGRNEVEVLGLIRQLPDVVVRALGASLIRDFARKERNVLIESDILHQTVIDLLDLVRPIAIALVSFTLVEDDALDDAVFLGLLRHIYQTLVRVIAIILDDILEPAGLGRHIALVKRRIERHDAAARNGHDHDTDPDLRVELFDQRASEVIRRAEAPMLVRQRGNRVIPRSEFPSVEVVDCREHLEARIDRLVLAFDSALALHIGLAEGEIDVEVGIRIGINRGRRHKRQPEQRSH